MVTNTASVAHDAYMVKTQMVHTITLNKTMNNRQLT